MAPAPSLLSLRDDCVPQQHATASLRALAARGIDVTEQYRQWLTSNLADRRSPNEAIETTCAQGKPLYIAGTPSAASLGVLLEANAEQPDGYAPALHLVEPEWPSFFAMLDEQGSDVVLGDTRVRLFVGPEAEQDFSHFLEERLAFDLNGPVIAPKGRDSVCASVERIFNGARERQSEELTRLLSANAARYTGRDLAFWRSRFQGAGLSEPLRILIPTTRHSTYVQHASGDLARAFEREGCEVMLLVEPDTSTRFTSLTYAKAVHDLRPDLVILINYTREHMQPAFPSGLPFICWIQDALQHLFDARIGAAQGPLDFVMGHVHGQLFTEFGYPREQVLFSPVLASETKFHAAPVGDACRNKFECEIAFVTNQSEPAEVLRDSLIASAGGNRDFAGVVNELHDRMRTLVDNIHVEPFLERAREEVVSLLGERKLAIDEAQVSALVNQVCLPLGDRLIRHETLEWAARIAQRRNWRLRVYGKGWEKHPLLAPYAQGSIVHGQDLRASYQCAAVNLHASINWNLHQRVMECALSGGLPLCRLKLSDVRILVNHARALIAEGAESNHANSNIEQFVCDAWDHPTALLLCDQLYQLDPAYISSCVNDGLERPRIRVGVQFRKDPWLVWGGRPIDREIPWLLGDLTQTTFRSEGELEQQIERAIESPAWRKNVSGGIAGRVKRHLTYERAAARILQFVADRCETQCGSPRAVSA